MKNNKIATMGLVLAITLSLLASSTSTAAKIRINKKKASMYVGKSTVLKIHGTKKTVRWSSARKALATVSSRGKVTAKKAGAVMITARVGKKMYRCKLTIKNPSTCKAKNGNNYVCKITVSSSTAGSNSASNQSTTQPMDQTHTHSYGAGVVSQVATSNSVGYMAYTCNICGQVAIREYGMSQTFSRKDQSATLYGYWDLAEARKIMDSINQYRIGKGLSELTLKEEYAAPARRQVQDIYFGVNDFNVITESGRHPFYINAVAQAACDGAGYFEHYIQRPGNDALSNASLFEKEDIEVGVGFFTEIKYTNFMSDSISPVYTDVCTENRTNYYVAVCIYE